MALAAMASAVCLSARACAADTHAGMTRVRASGLLIPVEVFFLFSTIVAIMQVRSTCAIAAACATPCHIGSSDPRACCLVRTDRRCACSCALHFASHCGAADLLGTACVRGPHFLAAPAENPGGRRHECTRLLRGGPNQLITISPDYWAAQAIMIRLLGCYSNRELITQFTK